MPATAIRPRNLATQTNGLEPGITTAEADLITATASRFLTRTDTGSRDATMTAIALQITTLFIPYTPASINEYNCAAPNGTHWCDGN